MLPKERIRFMASALKVVLDEFEYRDTYNKLNDENKKKLSNA